MIRVICVPIFNSLILLLLYLIFLIYPAYSQTISTSEWKQLVPSASLPSEIKTQDSNNNLDLVFFNGRYYFAFRTAPTHFASKKTKMYIVSSSDLEHWKFEKEISHRSDLREPRFLEYHGKLFFYYFEGGTKALRFEPKHVWACELNSVNEMKWTESRNVGLDGFVPWRLRTRNDTIYLSAYYGVGLYSSNHKSDLRLYISQNGYDWKPLSEQPQITGDSGEEGEFIFDEEGNLWGTVRLESTGALIVYADKNHLDKWQTKYTKYKYDSALLFRHNNDIYLVSRRNMDGEMDKAPRWFSKKARKQFNLLRYSLTKKKTALFKLNKKNMEMEHVMDFPSTGDTAFPGIVQKEEDTFILMNYSNNIHKRERTWINGQFGKTYIYWTELKFQ